MRALRSAGRKSLLQAKEVTLQKVWARKLRRKMMKEEIVLVQGEDGQEVDEKTCMEW